MNRVLEYSRESGIENRLGIMEKKKALREHSDMGEYPGKKCILEKQNNNEGELMVLLKLVRKVNPKL